MTPDLIEQFFGETPDGVTVRMSMPTGDLYVRKPARKRLKFDDVCYYFEGDTKTSRDAVFEETEILIDSSHVTMLTRLND
jgi:hypothetical protein